MPLPLETISINFAYGKILHYPRASKTSFFTEKDEGASKITSERQHIGPLFWCHFQPFSVSVVAIVSLGYIIDTLDFIKPSPSQTFQNREFLTFQTPQASPQKKIPAPTWTSTQSVSPDRNQPTETGDPPYGSAMTVNPLFTVGRCRFRGWQGSVKGFFGSEDVGRDGLK